METERRSVRLARLLAGRGRAPFSSSSRRRSSPSRSTSRCARGSCSSLRSQGVAELLRLVAGERRLLGRPALARSASSEDERCRARRASSRSSALFVFPAARSSASAGSRSTSTSFTPTWRATPCASASRSAGRSARGCRRGARRASLMVVAGLVATLVFAQARAARLVPVLPRLADLPSLGFAVAASCFWVDFVESRSLQAAPPDTCFIHGACTRCTRRDGQGLGAARHLAARAVAAAAARAGRRTAERPAHRHRERARRRACSAPPPRCKARFLDDVAARPDAARAAHDAVAGHVLVLRDALDGPRPGRRLPRRCTEAPVLWEVARARRLPHGVHLRAEPALRRLRRVLPSAPAST